MSREETGRRSGTSTSPDIDAQPGEVDGMLTATLFVDEGIPMGEKGGPALPRFGTPRSGTGRVPSATLSRSRSLIARVSQPVLKTLPPEDSPSGRLLRAKIPVAGLLVLAAFTGLVGYALAVRNERAHAAAAAWAAASLALGFETAVVPCAMTLIDNPKAIVPGSDPNSTDPNSTDLNSTDPNSSQPTSPTPGSTDPSGVNATGWDLQQIVQRSIRVRAHWSNPQAATLVSLVGPGFSALAVDSPDCPTPALADPGAPVVGDIKVVPGLDLPLSGDAVGRLATLAVRLECGMPAQGAHALEGLQATVRDAGGAEHTVPVSLDSALAAAMQELNGPCFQANLIRFAQGTDSNSPGPTTTVIIEPDQRLAGLPHVTSVAVQQHGVLKLSLQAPDGFNLSANLEFPDPRLGNLFRVTPTYLFVRAGGTARSFALVPLWQKNQCTADDLDLALTLAQTGIAGEIRLDPPLGSSTSGPGIGPGSGVGFETLYALTDPNLISPGDLRRLLETAYVTTCSTA